MSGIKLVDEWYIVKFDYKKSDGYWMMNEEVTIKVTSPITREKNNHAFARTKADDLLSKNYKQFVIHCITYV